MRQKSHNSGWGTTPSLVLKTELGNEFYVRLINGPDGDLIPIPIELDRPSNEFIEGDPYPGPCEPERIVQSIKCDVDPLVVEKLP